MLLSPCLVPPPRPPPDPLYMETKGDALHRAARLGDLSLLSKALDSTPELINEQDSKLGWSALYRAVICGHAEAARMLLKRGADPNVKSKSGDSPLHLAADDGNLRLVRMLLEAKAEPNLPQTDGETPLHKAATRGHHRICWLLLKHHADPNCSTTLSGRSPLHLAVSFNHTKVVKMLLSFDGSPDLKDQAGNTAIDLAPTDEMRETLKRRVKLPPISPKAERDSMGSDLSGTLSTPLPLLSDASESPSHRESITQLLEAISDIPLTSPENLPTVDECESMNTSSAASEGCDDIVVRSSVSKRGGSFEPESEQTEEMPGPALHRSFSFGADPKKSSMYMWLSQARLEALFDSLVEAGFDDIGALKRQMVSPYPLDMDGLRKIGIRKPGLRVRLLACLEEEARGRVYPRSRFPAVDAHPFQCCGRATFTPGVIVLPSFQQWLDSMNLQQLLSQFVDAGYDDLEHLFALMHTQYRVTDQTLKEEVNIGKPGYRQRVLIRLEEDCWKVESMFRGKEGEEDSVEMERDQPIEACSLCTIS